MAAEYKACVVSVVLIRHDSIKDIWVDLCCSSFKIQSVVYYTSHTRVSFYYEWKNLSENLFERKIAEGFENEARLLLSSLIFNLLWLSVCKYYKQSPLNPWIPFNNLGAVC